MKSFQSQTFYELLEVSVGASDADIRAAFDRLSRLYAEDQVALYGLIDEGRARALRTRLKEALEVLLDEERRATYDAKIGLPPREGAPNKRPAPVAQPVLSPAWSGSYAFVSSTPAAPASGGFSYTITTQAPSAVGFTIPRPSQGDAEAAAAQKAEREAAEAKAHEEALQERAAAEKAAKKAQKKAEKEAAEKAEREAAERAEREAAEKAEREAAEKAE
ncbi:MAG: DnaJ domain-containing protein, partial [Myxococcaceae bacterium]